MNFTNKRNRFQNYTLTAEGESVLNFYHPNATERRRIWSAMNGDSNYVPAPYLPTVSAIKMHSGPEMPCSGTLAVVGQLNNLSGFMVDDNRFALFDGCTGLVLEEDDDGKYTVVSTTVLDFTDHWHETVTGVVGMTKNGTVKTWLREQEEEESVMMPSGFQHVGDGHYLHNSLRISTSSPYQAELWADFHEQDMHDGRSLLVDWQSDRFTVMDATAPDRTFRVYRKTENDELDEWTHVENGGIKPMPEYTKDKNPYSTYIQTVYHVPLFVVDRLYHIRENFALCVGAPRTNLHCKEIYILQNNNVWSRVSDWNEENLERRFIPPDRLLSFRFQPRIGWAMTSVRHLRI